jgi:hypothetical protein
MEGSIELSALIKELRQELSEAMRAGADEDLRFELGPVELELSVAVERSGGPNAKVRFWVVEVGGDAKVSSATAQKIKLTLDPQDTRHPDRKPLISGRSVPGER